jgi:competence protein ComEC
LHVWRRRAARRLATGGDGSGLVRGLALGDRDAIAAPRREAFVRLGLAHALAVSGLHLAWVVASTFALAQRALARSAGLASRGDTRRAALWLAAGAGLLYAALAGWGIPVRRALLLLLAAGLAIARRRRVSSGSALGGAALCILAQEPGALFQPGAQLSFAAVAGLIAASGRRDAAAERAPRTEALARFVEETVRRSATAILATAPVLAWHGGGVSSVALLANALALPWLGIAVLPLALLAALAAGLDAPGWEWAVRAAAGLADLTSRALESLAAALPTLDRARPALAVGLGITALSAAGLAARGTLPRAFAAGLLAVALALAAAAPVAPAAPRLVALDVGQGDAIVVQDRRGAVLVDGAGAWSEWDSGRLRVVPALRALGIARLDLVIATHADLDHRGGLPAVLDALPVSELWLPWDAGVDEGFAPLLRVARARGVRVREVGAGSPPRRVGGLRIAPLWPPRGATGSRNARSLVVRIDAGEQRRALLPGDLDVEAERRLLERAVDLRADVLLLPHHGSRSSSSAAFLDAVAPRLAIASAPCRGRFGMPHREVRERLAARGTPLGWTGRDGALRVPLRGPLQLRGTGPPARCP